jgi:signal transduction histidine kinase/CheY-like chemotaxis protein
LASETPLHANSPAESAAPVLARPARIQACITGCCLPLALGGEPEALTAEVVRRLVQAVAPCQCRCIPPEEAESQLGPWVAALTAGREVMAPKGRCPAGVRRLLGPAAQWALALPVHGGGHWRGGLLFGGAEEQFNTAELVALRVLAAALGAALARSEAEAGLMRIHSVLARVLHSVPGCAILATDLQFDILHYNALAATVFALGPNDAVGRSLASTGVLAALGLASSTPVVRTVGYLQMWEAHCELQQVLGARTFHVLISGLRDDADELCGYILMARDVTEQREQERRMLEQQRMQSVGLLAGGVAHDFNNILMGILGYASLAKDRIEAGHPIQRMLVTMEQSAERAAELTRALLAYARGGKFQTVPVMLDDQVTELLGILATNLPKGVAIEKMFAPDLPYVLADPAQLQQVVMNICLNAGEAIAQHKRDPRHEDLAGVIAIRTGALTLDAQACRELALPPSDAGREFVFLEIADNGCGMDEETQRRIFEPFFSTKFAGRGLGLAAVEGIVRNHGGALRVQSALGAGTTFGILLPAAGRMERKAEEVPELPLGAGETVLVIDDEEIVRQLALLTLTNLGYNVMLAPDGDEGLAVFREHHTKIKLVLLDITMPGRNAAAILREFLRLEPQAAVLVTSGYDETAASGMVGEHLGAGFLHKPYTPEVLARAVRSVLDRGK